MLKGYNHWQRRNIFEKINDAKSPKYTAPQPKKPKQQKKDFEIFRDETGQYVWQFAGEGV